MKFNWIDPQSEYDKDKKVKPEEVQILVEWCKKQPHLPDITEFEGILFLHSCYYRLEPAKTTIDNYFTVRTHCPEIFRCPGETILRETLKALYVGALPKRTPDGSVIFVSRLIDSRPESYDCVNQLNVGTMSLTLELYQQGTDNGLCLIMDLLGCGFGHLTRMNLGAMKKFLYLVQEAAPIRIKGIHFVNLVPLTDKLVGLVKPFMKKELISLLNFHQNFESLHKAIPKEVLPKEYGGTASDIATLHSDQCKKILDNTDFFKAQDLLKVDEGSRPGKPRDIDQIFGLEGTFKKLEVD